MLSQRVGVAAMRGATKPFFAQNLPKMALAARLPTQQYRPVATTQTSQTEGRDILANQRLQRPISPHLGIYKMEQTWFGASAWTRITGCSLSGAAYLYFTSYLAAPLFGWHLESQVLAESLSGMPVVHTLLKFGLAFPFTYHFIVGIKHLIYDMGIGFQKATIVKGEIALWASSVLGALGLAFGL